MNMNEFQTVPAELHDLPSIEAIYARARRLMAETGNPTQWGTTKPDMSLVRADIAKGQCYKILSEHEICGVFSLLPGEEPTYREIDGGWHSESAYITIHRLASSGAKPGVFSECFRFCREKAAYIRIDTHENNRIMRHLLQKRGFQYCGIIHLADGSPRLAFYFM